MSKGHRLFLLHGGSPEMHWSTFFLLFFIWKCLANNAEPEFRLELHVHGVTGEPVQDLSRRSPASHAVPPLRVMCSFYGRTSAMLTGL